MNAERIQWDMGTGYDMFVSLNVLHDPSHYDLRAAWAAGMRSRLPTAERELLETLHDTMYGKTPLRWIYGLDGPKDGATVLRAVADIPAEERLLVLSHMPEEIAEVLRSVGQRGIYKDDDVQALRAASKECWKKTIPVKKAKASLDLAVAVDEIGIGLLSALKAYYEVFFHEEENRIRPALETALEEAQAKSEHMELRELLEELSQGVRFAREIEDMNLVLAPSFWGAPWVMFDEIDDETELILFGARPANASLVPGEVVPDALVRALKALSDPTRLRIMRYLVEEPLTPTQLANRLRLRAPTVVHHLGVLRNAGLVYVDLRSGKEKSYQAREEGVAITCAALSDFLMGATDR